MYRIEYGRKSQTGKSRRRILLGILALILGFGIQKLSVTETGTALETAIQNFSAGDTVKTAVESFCEDLIFGQKEKCS